MSAQLQTTTKPRLLFVDDEQRVLNSMRIMFRRQFDLYLASHGAEALDIIKSQDIDVIVADHRMPRMTGVEVLAAVRTLSPRTIRILLTGYADLDAVEGSINDCEVFRFLTKPCPPQQLRDTIELAVKVAREAPVPVPMPVPAAPTDGAGAEELDGEETIEIVLESDTFQEYSHRVAAPHAQPAPAETARPAARRPDARETPAPLPARQPKTRAEAPAAPRRAQDMAATDVIPPARPRAPEEPEASDTNRMRTARKPRLAIGFAVVVFSSDQEVIETVQKAVRGRLPVYQAGNIVQVVKILTEHQPGVLVTDISEDKTAIQAMTARLKDHLPELVTIAVSQHRDVLDMVWLINHGQIFRFLRKPLSPGRCAVSLQAALQHHRTLLKNPELAKRYEVDAAETGLVDGVLAKLRTVKRLWASV